MELDAGGVATYGLHLANHDFLPVNLDACGSKAFSNLYVGYRTVDGTGGADLHGDYEGGHSINLSCQSLSLFLNLSQFVSLLAEILSQHFLCALSGVCSLACGYKIVVGIAVLDFHDIVLETQADNIFFKYNFHSVCPPLLFHHVGYERQQCKVAGTLNGLCHAALILE